MDEVGEFAPTCAGDVESSGFEGVGEGGLFVSDKEPGAEVLDLGSSEVEEEVVGGVVEGGCFVAELFVG